MCTALEGSEHFKECKVCGFVWKNRDDFLSDPNIETVGYQPHFRNFVTGNFLFNHTCKTTLAICAAEFKDLYKGPIFEDRAKRENDRAYPCLRLCNRYSCRSTCECDYVNELLKMFRNWPKDFLTDMHTFHSRS